MYTTKKKSSLSNNGIIKTNGILCLYGGISFNDYGEPLLSHSAYCTNLGIESTETLSPTTLIPTTSIPTTIIPTIYPTYNPTTSIPTISPTITDITTPIF
eukprot:836598_1